MAILGLGLVLMETVVGQEPGSDPQRARRERRKGLTELFDQYDVDKDGRVTAAELKNPGMMLLLDKDNDGVVTRREASESLTSIGAERRWAKPAKPGEKPASAGNADPLTEALVQVSGAGLGVGRRLPELKVRTLDGVELDLGGRPAGLGRVIAVTSSSCPISRKFAPGLGRLEQAWSGRGVEFIYVGALPVDGAGALQEMAVEAGWKGRLIRDADERIGAALGLRTTAEVLVVDAAGTLVYRGAVSDQYGLGYSRASARQEPLQEALQALQQGLRPTLEATTAPGCVLERKQGPVGWVGRRDLTYHGRISRILQTHCVECHREGGLGPFPLEGHADVVGHAGMIRRQVEKGQMPPWFAAPEKEGGHARWMNNRAMPPEDRDDLLAWLASDRPLGDPKDAPLPVRRVGEWTIGKPDVIYQIPRPVRIPAEGVMAYEYAFVDTDEAGDRWVEGVEIRPTASAVVHHVLVWAMTGDKGRRRRAEASGDEISGFFAVYVPGNAAQVFPEGFGKRLPAGATLKFQVHYTPNGKATNDQLRIGLRFAKEKPRNEVHVLGLINPGIRIPAGAANHEEWAAVPVPRDARILSFFPHMHVRGKAFRYEVTYPSGVTRMLLDVPRYDFNWQLCYRLAEPLLLPKGSRLRATAWFDNSSGNPANPDPTKNVRWGNQTYEEMMIGYLEYYLPAGGI